MNRRDKLILLLATWFWSGRLPYMPGTWGSLAALPLWWLLQPLSLGYYSLVMLLLALSSVYLCDRAEVIVQQADPPVIVLDEVVGQLIALAGCPPQVSAVGLAVILFRLFDIVKPFPIGLINDRWRGGLGIVMDDVLAGVFAGLLSAILRAWFW
jgi:phosphatidylglycerophosphatase A